MIRTAWGAAALSIAFACTPALAKSDPPVELTHCDKSIATVAVVDGDTQGWTKYGLGSPRELIAALARQSGCFTPYDAAGGQPANVLLNVIAGDKEEVDKGIQMAKGALTEGLVRSGAAGAMVGRVPFGGAALGMFGGLGGKKKTVAAGIRVISPASGQTLVSGTGEVTRTSITFGGTGDPLSAGAQAAGYASSKDGQMLVEAFVKAFNSVLAQRGAIQVPALAAPAPATPGALTAIDTRMLAEPRVGAAVLRSVRAGSALKPTGKREGLFVEAEDGFGTRGWLSVEDLK